jgi:hypothetical protein
MNAKKARGKYAKATTTIGKFTDDRKGLRAGDLVKFPIDRSHNLKKETGILKRIFKHDKNNPPKNKGDEEARILGPVTGTNPKGRYYRDLDEVEKVDK